MKRVFKLISLFLFLLTSSVDAMSLLSLQGAVDWSCIGFEVIGVCTKPTPPYIGIKVRYWEPVLIIETVKNPGDFVIEELGAVVSGVTKEASKNLLAGSIGLSISVSSGSSSQSLTGSNLQFNEVHVYGFPFVDIFSSLLSSECDPTGTFVSPVKYLTELDSFEWRFGLVEALSPKSMLSSFLGIICSGIQEHSGGLCMGSWGPVYPRRGFFTHQSEVVASAAAAIRAVSIAGLQDFSPHVILSPLGFIPDLDKDKLQLIYPVSSGCIKIGLNPLLWEGGKTSFNGKYVWVYWRHRTCCIY